VRCRLNTGSGGNLLHEGFEQDWYYRASKFWRVKDFAPESCKKCDKFDYCYGACPLYWDGHGFEEIKEFWSKGSKVKERIDEVHLNLRRRIRGDQHGIT